MNVVPSPRAEDIIREIEAHIDGRKARPAPETVAADLARRAQKIDEALAVERRTLATASGARKPSESQELAAEIRAHAAEVRANTVELRRLAAALEATNHERP